jgi:mono/diheme cytochrome c family protein
MRRIGTAFTGLLLLSLFAYGQAKQEPPKSPPSQVPAEEARRENPVKPTPAGLEAAKKFFGTDCALCHGKDGDGKGELAADMKAKMKDWRDPASLEKFTDGELFFIITKGRGEMMGEEGRAKPEQCWQLVNYVRSLAKKESAAKKPEKPS